MNLKKLQKIGFAFALTAGALTAQAQTNVFDNVISTSPNHTSLAAAINAANLAPALRSADSTYTVFAPDNDAFNQLAADLGTNITGLLALPNLSDILLYHVLGDSVNAGAVTNGLVAQPLNAANTIKLTKTSTGNVFANQAQVNAADLRTDNGIVHSVNSVLLANETVVDIALDNGFSTLATAVITAELLPALTNPFDTVTVFAPTNAAFDNLATALNTDLNAILALPNLADILTYHVLAGSVPSSAITNGLIVNPLSPTNSLKLTKTSNDDVFLNQANITGVDVSADNGLVHILDAVVLPNETVIDVAIDNGFSTLVTALVTAELVPTLISPFDSFTVFAPTNEAFDSFASQNNLTLNDILALPTLGDVLTYHVVAGQALSTDLSAGNLATLNGADVIIDLTGGVTVNASNVTQANVTATNGVVHVIDAVLDQNFLSTSNLNVQSLNAYPNPVNNTLNLKDGIAGNFEIIDFTGKIIKVGEIANSKIDLADLKTGSYIVRVTSNSQNYVGKITKN